MMGPPPNHTNMMLGTALPAPHALTPYPGGVGLPPKPGENKRKDEVDGKKDQQKNLPNNASLLSAMQAAGGTLIEGLDAFGLAQYHCDVCNRDISNVCRIRCADCEDFDLCVKCFCIGAEVKGKPHKNTHRYIPIGRNAFPLLKKDWTADEEIMLLEGVSKYGFGNWNVRFRKGRDDIVVLLVGLTVCRR